MRIEWSPAAIRSARRHAEDQDGMQAIGTAVAHLADDPYPADAFHRGEYHRLRVGPYRVAYMVDADVITISRVERIV
ncbi:MAG TPA: type II toxin-antitoxin system RelE/ParE family toxin [Streptosporangiaceae bacterium]|nr:type II toxin-antitoxin system RelE/ParE family toxin [Streptosporangiaceae bacterium]